MLCKKTSDKHGNSEAVERLQSTQNRIDRNVGNRSNGPKLGYTGYGKANKPKVNRNILILVA